MVEPSAGDATVADPHNEVGPTAREPTALVIADAVGRYVVVSRLGAGGMGVVYAAYDPELDRRVALKLLRGGDESGVATGRLLREAQAMAKLSHPNVIAVHDVGEHEGSVFVAMEFVDGGTIGQWAREQPRGWREIVRVFTDAGRGLAAAHAHELVHRDFKPDNVMVGKDGRVRVMDFGLARASADPSAPVTAATESDPRKPSVDALRSDLTRDGAVMGTPAYMAPEQHLGLVVGAPADQFAFCVALYECLYGERPFPGETPAQIAFNVLEGELRDPPSGTDVPSWVRAVVVRGLAREPQARWPSMHALIAALGRDPSQQRRVYMGSFAVVAIAVGGWGWHELGRARAREACEVAAQAIDETWHPARADAVADAFAGTGLGYASDSWTRATSLFDDWSDRWSEARRRVCTASTIDDNLAVATADASTRCLDAQRHRLEALLGVLERADPAAVSRAVSSAADLPAPATCLDPARLAEWEADTPRTRDARQAIRDRLANADAMRASARFDEALELAQGAATDAEVMEANDLRARALLDASIGLGELGRLEEAATAARDAYMTAGAEGDDRVALLAASRLVEVLGGRLTRHDEATWWTDLVHMHIDRLGEDTALEVATAYSALGLFDGGRGAYDEAHDHLERSLKMRIELLGQTHPAVARSWVASGMNALARGDHETALEQVQRGLNLREAVYGPDHPRVADVLNNLANVLRTMGRYDEAEPLYRRCLEIKEAALGPEHLDLAVPLNNLGFMYTLQDRYDEAEAALEQALAIKEKALGPDNPDLARTLANLGAAYRQHGKLGLAEATMKRAVDLHVRSLGADHPTVAITMSNYALLLKAQGKFEEAREIYLKIVPVQEKALGGTHPDLGSSLANLATIERELGRDTDAQGHLERALEIMQAEEVPPGHRALVQYELGSLLWASGGDRQRAVELVSAAYATAARLPQYAKETEGMREWLQRHGDASPDEGDADATAEG